jgi:hypothetical protein
MVFFMLQQMMSNVAIKFFWVVATDVFFYVAVLLLEMLQYTFFVVTVDIFRCCNRFFSMLQCMFFNVVVDIFSMLQYIFFVCCSRFFRCCSRYFSMLQCMFQVGTGAQQQQAQARSKVCEQQHTWEGFS